MKVLQSEYNLLLVVVEANLRYFKPAKLDDLIEVTVHIEEIKGATFRVLQRAYRDVDLLTEGVIHLGALHTDTVLPCRIPTDLRQSICRCQLQSF
jgi:acyl-CoA thioester hydrolase